MRYIFYTGSICILCCLYGVTLRIRLLTAKTVFRSRFEWIFLAIYRRHVCAFFAVITFVDKIGFADTKTRKYG